MTRVLIAQDLRVRTEQIAVEPQPVWMGVEFSRPISMIGATTVSVAGQVLDVSQSQSEQCDLEIQGTNDLTTWFRAGGPKMLPQFARSPFSLAGISVPYRFVRVRYVIRQSFHPMGPSYWIITAELETN